MRQMHSSIASLGDASHFKGFLAKEYLKSLPSWSFLAGTNKVSPYSYLNRKYSSMDFFCSSAPNHEYKVIANYRTSALIHSNTHLPFTATDFTALQIEW